MTYCKPLRRAIGRGQRFGANPGWGPNPAGGHNGDDYLSFPGESVHAAGDGVVLFAGQFDSSYADNFGWNLNFGGNMVVLNLDGASGPYVEYGHLEQIHVKAGDRVRRGQVIATTGATDGNTGVITGAHLHVGVLPPNFDLTTNTYGRVNPDLYLTEYPDTLAPAGDSITPIKEDTLSAADVKAINAHTTDEANRVIKYVGDLLTNEYKMGSTTIPGGNRVGIETQRRVSIILEIVKAQAANPELSLEQITAAIDEAMDKVVTVDVNVGGKVS